MFKYKTEAELAAMTPEQRDIYSEQKREHEAKERQKEIAEALKTFGSTREVRIKAQNPGKTNEEIKSLADAEIAAETKAAADAKKQMDELTESVNQIKEQGGVGGESKSSLTGQVHKFIDDNLDKIKSIFKAGTGAVEFEINKAVANITTASGTNTAPPNIVGTQLAPVQNVNLREIPVLNLTTRFNTKQAAFAYTEAKPKDGDYAFVAEGTAKPQIDFSWETNYAKPVKAAAWIRLTEEAVEDVDGLKDVATDYLLKKHNLKKARGILFGDGVAPNPKGATEYGRVFSAGAMALAVVNPNFMDVVNAAITDIATTHNYEDETPYMANLVMINPIDFFLNLVSAKDADGKPLYPTATLFNMVNIGGVTIMPEESIPVGDIFIADMGAYNTTNYVPYSVKIGWINDDFIKNQFVMLGESRFHAFVKKLAEQAFIYDEIATIKTAITAA